MTRLGGVFLVAFAADAALSLLDELLGPAGGDGPLAALRFPVASFVILLSALLWLGMLVTPRLPKRILVAPTLFALWCGLGAQPLARWLAPDRTPWAGLSFVQAGLAALAFVQVRRRTRGRWLPTRDAFRAPAFAWRASLGFGLATLLLGPPLVAIQIVCGAADAIEARTAGFLRFDREGVLLSERRYVRGDREVTLVGMLHVGEPEAYRALYDGFATPSTVVLAEGVTDDGERLAAPLSYEKVAAGLGLVMQPPVGGGAQGPGPGAGGERWPRVVRADVDTAAFSPDTIAFLDRAAELWSGDEPARDFLRFVAWTAAPERQPMLAAVEKDVIRDRNAHVIDVLDEVLPEYHRVVIPWGGLHLAGIEPAVLARGFAPAGASERRLLRWSTVLAGLREAGEHGVGTGSVSAPSDAPPRAPTGR